MKHAVKADEVPWVLQDLREQLLLAQADQVRIVQVIRETLRDPRNHGRFGTGSGPLYVSPDRAVEALRGLAGQVPYLTRRGYKNRVKPEVLLSRYERAAESAENMARQVAAAERQLGLCSPEEDDPPEVTRERLHSLWDSAPGSPAAARTINALARGGYMTVTALTRASERDLRDIPSFGDGCLAEVRRVLDFHGLHLVG